MARQRDGEEIVPLGLELRRSRIGLVLGIGGVALALLAVASLTMLPSLLVDGNAYRDPATGRINRIELETAKNELSRTLLQGVAALGLGATAIVTWWRIRLSEFEVGAGAHGQITERFSRALEHLASDSTVVRIGGVYALERIAQQSAWDRDPIFKLLVGFATERSRIVRDTFSPAPIGDIEAAVLALVRSGRVGAVAERLNLAGLHLPGVDLSWSLNLRSANLSGAILTGARLAGAELPAADFTGANLDDVDLANVTMPRCDLTGASALRVHVLDADMRELRAESANFGGAFFGDVILYRSRFDGAQLDGTKLLGVDLSDSTFDRASLRGATIGNCWLAGVDFTGADLAGVIWVTADGTGNAWDPAFPPTFPAGTPELSPTSTFWGDGPPRRDTY